MAGQFHWGASSQLRLLRPLTVKASMAQQDALDVETIRLDAKEADLVADKKRLIAEKAQLDAKEAQLNALPPGDPTYAQRMAVLRADKEELTADKEALAADKAGAGGCHADARARAGCAAGPDAR